MITELTSNVFGVWSKKCDFHVLTLRNGLTLLLCFIFVLPIRFVTRRGYRSIPAIRACPKGLSAVPSSLGLIITAFLPAYRPLRTSTTATIMIIKLVTNYIILVRSIVLSLATQINYCLIQTNASIVLKILGIIQVRTTEKFFNRTRHLNSSSN